MDRASVQKKADPWVGFFLHRRAIHDLSTCPTTNVMFMLTG